MERLEAVLALMAHIHVIPNIDRFTPPGPVGDILHSAADWTLMGLPQGMKSGRTSVMISAPVTVNGRTATVVLESSLQVFHQAMVALAAEYRSEIERPGYARSTPVVRGLIKSRIFDHVLPALGNDMTVADEIAELCMRALEDDTGQEQAP